MDRYTHEYRCNKCPNGGFLTSFIRIESTSTKDKSFENNNKATGGDSL